MIQEINSEMVAVKKEITDLEEQIEDFKETKKKDIKEVLTFR